MNCKECGEKIEQRNDIWGGTFETLVGYHSPPGHNHDDNCRTRIYECKNGHSVKLSVRRRCDACDWVGKDECFCHLGKKIRRMAEMKDERFIDAEKELCKDGYDFVCFGEDGTVELDGWFSIEQLEFMIEVMREVLGRLK